MNPPNTTPDGDEVELREAVYFYGDLCAQFQTFTVTINSVKERNEKIRAEGDKLLRLISAHTEAKVREAFMWEQYTGDYTKQYYDIKLWSGEIYENCWPNANTFHEGVIGKVIEGKDVCYIRARGAAQPPKEGS